MYVRTNTAYEYRVTNSKITFYREREKQQKQRAAWTKHSQQRKHKATCHMSKYWYGLASLVRVFGFSDRLSLALYVSSLSPVYLLTLQVNEMKFFGSFLSILRCMLCASAIPFRCTYILYKYKCSCFILKGIFMKLSKKYFSNFLSIN